MYLMHFVKLNNVTGDFLQIRLLLPQYNLFENMAQVIKTKIIYNHICKIKSSNFQDHFYFPKLSF